MPYRVNADVEQGRRYQVEQIEGVKVQNAQGIWFPLSEDLQVRTKDMGDTVVVNKRSGAAVKVNHRAGTASDCPEDVVPTFGADPTHLLNGGTTSIGGTAIAITDNTNTLVRFLVSGRSNIGHPWVDYNAGHVYWMERNDSTNNITLRRIDFDGTGEVQILDLSVAGASNEANHVNWDEGAGKFLLHASDAQFTCNKDGSGLTVVGTLSNLRGVYPYNDGSNYVVTTLSGINTVKRSFAGAQTDGIDGSGSELAFYRDIPNGRAFYIRRLSPGARLEYVDDDNLTGAKTVVDTEVSTDTSGFHIMAKDRWLYYHWDDPNSTNFGTRRRHLDDLTRVELVFTFRKASFWPWNE